MGGIIPSINMILFAKRGPKTRKLESANGHVYRSFLSFLPTENWLSPSGTGGGGGGGGLGKFAKKQKSTEVTIDLRGANQPGPRGS